MDHKLIAGNRYRMKERPETAAFLHGLVGVLENTAYEHSEDARLLRFIDRVSNPMGSPFPAVWVTPDMVENLGPEMVEEVK